MTVLSPLALLLPDQMADCDRRTIEDGRFAGYQLMENAGAAVTAVALANFGTCAGADVLCGTGNNGGDGYVVARLLAETGMPVRVFASAPPRPGTDAALAAKAWNGPVEPLANYRANRLHLVIDALFGAGFRGILPAIEQSAVGMAREAGSPILAIDLPSGVDGATGLSGGAIAATTTVTFHRRKPGHLLMPGTNLCGRLAVADIGLDPSIVPEGGPRLYENRPALWQHAWQSRRIDWHKYSRGHVAVFSGPVLSTGASRLAAMAAQRAGAGAVTLLGPADALAVHACHVTSIMLRETGRDPLADLSALKGRPAAVIGPGFGDVGKAAAIAVACAAGQEAGVTVIDADALTGLAADEALSTRLGEAAKGRAVLTPHDGEFGRLFPDLSGNAALGKWQKAIEAARRTQTVIVCKGPDTVIAEPDGRIAINTNAGPELATAGSGDVLAGIIASLAAQGMPAFEAACAGVWLHGEAGRLAGPRMIAEDLVACIEAAINAIDTAPGVPATGTP